MAQIQQFCQVHYQQNLLDFVKEKAEAGLTATQTARLLFASPTYIRQYALKHGIRFKKVPPKRFHINGA